MNFLHNFHPQAIAFSVGPLAVHWYGLFIVIGLLAGFLITLYIAKKKRVDTTHLYNLFFYFIFFGLIGGRVAHVFSEGGYYNDHLSDIYKIWLGGLSLHGVLLGCLVTLIIYSKVKKVSFWLLADILAVATPLAQSIGRWGNYFNQEIFGRPTNLPWSIPVDLEKRPVGFEGFDFFHPLFLYESILNLIIFVVLLLLSRAKFVKQGEILLIYLIAYSSVRFCLDFLRIDQVSLGSLSLAQWASLLIIIVALAIFIIRRRQLKT